MLSAREGLGLIRFRGHLPKGGYDVPTEILDDSKSISSVTAMNEATERARDIAKKVLARQYDPLLACRELIDPREQLPVMADEVMDVFRAVDSEVDGLPIGPERAHWNTESLRVNDLQAADYRERVRGQVADALRELLEVIGNEGHS